MKEKILLGMSGGVDSSVSAILLKEKGYEVVGCTMRLWNEKEESDQAVQDAKRVCEQLEIEHVTCDYYAEFQCHVIQNFIQEYQEARTPNPCVECNQFVKFGLFYEKAKELGCQAIATGHYARIEYSEKYEQMVLKKAKANEKDQSYFLYTISKEKLEKIVFPLQDYMDKEEIRKIAKQNQLSVAQKKDSQEICFIPNNDYQGFLKKYGNQKLKNGNIKLTTGQILGKHQGLTNYTIGQRKGLGISYFKPLYVVDLDQKNHEVIVGLEEELYANCLIANEINWMIPVKGKLISCFAKIRYRAKEAKATVFLENDQVKVEFFEAQRAITPGQSIVFYDEDGIVLGGGKILGKFQEKLVYSN